MDEDFDGQLSYGEFRKAMRDYKTGLEDFELKALFQFLSSLNGQKDKVQIDTSITYIRGSMNQRRTQVVR